MRKTYASIDAVALAAHGRWRAREENSVCKHVTKVTAAARAAHLCASEGGNQRVGLRNLDRRERSLSNKRDNPA